MLPVQYQFKNLNHLGLVAAMCRELRIAEYIDARITNDSDVRHVTIGQAVVAMIINGLGFTGQTLYMFPEFFEDKPIDRLIGEGIQPEHLNDKVLGRALDSLYDAGVSDLYLNLAVKVVNHLKLPCKALNLDGTSFHVDGIYNSHENPDDLNCIHICRGYSRDHRPDLNQVVLQLMTENEAGIPVFMAPASGNVNDKTCFQEIIKNHLSCFKETLNSRYLVADAAMYVAETLQLLDEQKQLFISRVPLNIKGAKELVGKAPAMSLEPVEGYEDYYSAEVPSCYGDVKQRWFLFLNKKRRLVEQKTLTRKVQKQSLKEARDLEKLGKKAFLCRDDALKAFALWQKQSKLCQSATEPEVTGKPCYSGRGRPSPDSKPDHFEYFVQAECFVPCQKRENAQASLGCFILGTNELDQNCMSATELLSTYKSQQQVEGGFRFLKSPDFLVSSLYLKKAERIEALLMVMTLCLMVYAAIQHKIRHELKKQSRVFPNQKKKPCQNPTARWVFFCFQGINVLTVNNQEEHVVGLKERQCTIMQILGNFYESVYS
ncbi:IS1634 family transposase [Endozoicomonas sp. ALB091]|uniref:IS1634 family transposase n=1 Tax=Endozoicomonas sp. ALB091 TaxID=3403073 RepID=UPI003BB72988